MRKKFSIFYLIIVFVSLSSNSIADNIIYLLPKERDIALQAILKNIEQSKKSIKISIYNFTHKKIAKKLASAARRGVKVEIIFDEESAKRDKKRSMIYFLVKYKNITIYKLKGRVSKNGKYYGIMHLKTALFDNKKVLFGSANWSYSAFSNNYELLYITKDYALAKKIDKHFQQMKKESKIFK